MAYQRTCPHCRASLDPGEACTCRGMSDHEVGERLDARTSEIREREEAREKLKSLSGRVSYRLVDRPDCGPTVIEADVDGEAAFRFDAYYDGRQGIWRLYPKKALNLAYRCLHLVKRLYIDEVKDARYSHSRI